MTRQRTIEDRIYLARAARSKHSEECVLWDYESNGGCEECEEHDRKLATLIRERASKAGGK